MKKEFCNIEPENLFMVDVYSTSVQVRGVIIIYAITKERMVM